MEPRHGFMIQCPMGTGKTHWLNQLTKTQHTLWDGDELLKKHGVKNKNDYWYDENNEEEQFAILNVFDQYLNLGHWIFYSGNPFLIQTDLIILPDEPLRWQQLQQREGYRPSFNKFRREQRVYQKAYKECKIFIHGNIPSYDFLVSIYNEFIHI